MKESIPFEINRVNPVNAHPAEIRREAARLFRTGKGPGVTARLLCVPFYTVRDWYRAWRKNEFDGEVAEAAKRYDDDTRKGVVALHGEGYSWTEVERITGISRASAMRWAKLAADKRDSSKER